MDPSSPDSETCPQCSAPLRGGGAGRFCDECGEEILSGSPFLEVTEKREPDFYPRARPVLRWQVPVVAVLAGISFLIGIREYQLGKYRREEARFEGRATYAFPVARDDAQQAFLQDVGPVVEEIMRVGKWEDLLPLVWDAGRLADKLEDYYGSGEVWSGGGEFGWLALPQPDLEIEAARALLLIRSGSGDFLMAPLVRTMSGEIRIDWETMVQWRDGLLPAVVQGQKVPLDRFLVRLRQARRGGVMEKFGGHLFEVSPPMGGEVWYPAWILEGSPAWEKARGIRESRLGVVRLEPARSDQLSSGALEQSALIVGDVLAWGWRGVHPPAAVVEDSPEVSLR